MFLDSLKKGAISPLFKNGVRTEGNSHQVVKKTKVY